MANKPERLDVLFRKRFKADDVTAVFPSVAGRDEYDMSCYVHIGQHGACDQGWYNKTRKAKPEEYADLLAELRQIYAPEYELRVVSRITKRHREARCADMERMRYGK